MRGKNGKKLAAHFSHFPVKSSKDGGGGRGCSGGGSARAGRLLQVSRAAQLTVDPGGIVFWETLFTPLLLFNSGVAVFSCSY